MKASVIAQPYNHITLGGQSRNLMFESSLGNLVTLVLNPQNQKGAGKNTCRGVERSSFQAGNSDESFAVRGRKKWGGSERTWEKRWGVLG